MSMWNRLAVACLLFPAVLGADPPAPKIAQSAFVDSRASLVGDVTVGERAFLAPCSSVRSGPGASVVIGDESNVQDGAVVVGVSDFGFRISNFRVEVQGVRIGRRTTVAAQAQVYGPARVGDNVFVGMQALVFNADVGDGCVIEPGAMVMGVRIPPGRYVPASLVVIDQDAAEALPGIGPHYPFREINEKMVAACVKMAEEYQRKMKDKK
ncbi:MAG: carbonic anhydrase [Candidatus Latescibacteria bacterium]|nr:carbonic anhydrase [Candidatus Latescibacterota bacterium]